MNDNGKDKNLLCPLHTCGQARIINLETVLFACDEDVEKHKQL